MAILDLHGLDAYYSDQGEGIPVVLTHADCSSGDQWRKLGHHLGDGFRMLALDQYGHGRSQPWHEGQPYDFEEVALLKVLMESVEEPVHLVGHSAGGCMTVRLALQMKERVATLTLIEPALWHLLGLGNEQEADREIRNIASEHTTLLERGEFTAAAKCFIDYWSGEGSWDRIPLDRRSPILAASLKVGVEWICAFSEKTPLDAYHDLNMPTLLIRGKQTKLPASRTIDLLANSLPNCNVVEISGAGHMSPITHPEPVNEVIAEHLNRHKP